MSMHSTQPLSTNTKSTVQAPKKQAGETADAPKLEKKETRTDPVLTKCPICFCQVVEPCRLPCAHIFCIKCALEIQEKNLMKYKCPLCRGIIDSSFKPSVDLEL